ncbi:Protein of unknown function [Pyronema omphalodes CBS 100304]|uniref:Uncharacterized protein n=1 Tax=Pyronema omphalodes (strain CBS 100304) TaxID=1076935 RepID=U4LIG7_PYROM|nr:Protein of unknown function [Pyronema omphalodes CBS 100304]
MDSISSRTIAFPGRFAEGKVLLDSDSSRRAISCDVPLCRRGPLRKFQRLRNSGRTAFLFLEDAVRRIVVSGICTCLLSLQLQ